MSEDTNNNNEEVVTENSIYIADKDNNTYYNVLKRNLNGNTYIGIFNIDLRKRTRETDGGTRYYYPQKFLADYDSVVYQTDVVKLGDENIYDYVDKNSSLAKIYYTALGRERYGLYKVNRNVEDLLEKY